METLEKLNLIRLSGTDVKKCMKCGKCSASCPSFEEMDIKPHQFVGFLANGRTEELLKSKSLWSCLSCLTCVERCPRGVAPANVIEAVRVTVEREQGKDGVLAEDIIDIVDDKTPQQLLVSVFRKYKK